MCGTERACGGCARAGKSKNNFWSCFSSTVWILGIERWSSGLAARAFNPGANSLAEKKSTKESAQLCMKVLRWSLPRKFKNSKSISAAVQSVPKPACGRNTAPSPLSLSVPRPLQPTQELPLPYPAVPSSTCPWSLRTYLSLVLCSLYKWV